MQRLKPFLAAAVLSALGLEVPAQAGPVPADRNAALVARIDDSMRQGLLMRPEANRLLAMLDQLKRDEVRDRASPPGLTDQERKALDGRYEALWRRVPLMEGPGPLQGHSRH